MQKFISFVVVVLVGSLLLYQAGLKHGYQKGVNRSKELRRKTSEVLALYGENKTRPDFPQRFAEGVTDSISDIITIWD